MPQVKDMTGQRFGLLTVVRLSGKDKRGEMIWECLCDCGNTTFTVGNRLRSGKTKSCGCLQRKHRKEGFNRKHGMTDSRLYTAWLNMRNRCYSVNNIMYQNYGGRGICVCDEWRNSFENFMSWANGNGYQEGLTLERINVDGNYEPSNCTWITKTEQYLNRTDSHKITAFGKTQTIKEWSSESGLKYDTIERRINQYGWSAEEAVTIKPHQRKR